MRREFADLLLRFARTDERIVLVTMDLGFGLWDDFRRELPNQFFNVGASEQDGILTCVGMSYEGLTPFAYSITPFLLHRPAEAIKLYLEYEKANVKLIGSGRGQDYAHDGVSHWDTGCPFDIPAYAPKTVGELETIFPELFKPGPMYVNLKR